MNPCSHAHLIFDKVAKNKRCSCCQENWMSACKKLKHCISINSKWIKYLNIRPETLKLVQEREWNTLDDFLSRIQMTQQLRERIDKQGYMKLRSFCTAKETVSKLKRLPTEWEKIFASCSSEGLTTEYTEISKN
jgi:hypothetical protein